MKIVYEAWDENLNCFSTLVANYCIQSVNFRENLTRTYTYFVILIMFKVLWNGTHVGDVTAPQNTSLQ